MKKILLVYVLLIVSIPMLLAQEPPEGFIFTPTPASAGVIATVEVGGAPASDADWVAAFDEDQNCAGAVQLLDYYSMAFLNLQVYGDDILTEDDEGLEVGQPFTFKLWSAATGNILDHPEDLELPIWDNTTGVPLDGYGFADGAVLRFSGGGAVAGCMDMTACNYDASATEEDPDNPCIFATGCDTCADDGTVVDNPEEGEACDDGNPDTTNDAIQADCSCAGESSMIIEDSDECITAVNISAAFSEECEMIGPYEQGDATVGDIEPPAPSCFNDGYDGTTWYSFVVPDDIAGGNPTDYIISTGAFSDCTSNPLESNADTQIAVYEGPDCPGGSSIAIACNDDYSNTPPYVSSVQTTLTPGAQYYIMVETFGGNLSGEFCFYIQPLADFLGGGTKDCTNCGDDVCNGVVGESFAACPGDCPCDAGFASYNFNADGTPNQSLNYEAFCADVVGGEGSGQYIPFSITSDNVPMGPDGITFLNSTLTVTVGSIMNYTFNGSPTPFTGDATQNVTLIYLTDADIAAVQGGTPIVLNFVDESGECNIAEQVAITLDSGLCETGGVEGCTNADACNYNELATVDDNSCNVPDGACEVCDGDNVIVQDADGDGVCDADEIAGCMDSAACNFDPAATDPGDCSFNDCEGVCGGPAVTGSACDDNGTAGTYDENCNCVPDFVPVLGCTNADACNYDETANTDDDSCNVPDGACDVCDGDNVLAQDADGDGVCDADEIAGCMDEMACNYDPAATDPADCSLNDCEGVCGGTAVTGTACDDNGTAGTYNENCECVADFVPVLGCTNADACNYDAAANTDDDSCNVPDGACEVCDGDNVAVQDADGDGVCDADEIAGCMDEMACNYDPAATDPSDCNSNDCEGVCGGSAVTGAACDVNGIAGTYDDNCNCNPIAAQILGCTNADACNYEAAANTDDDSCIVVEAGSITLADGSSETEICVSDDVDEPIDIAVVDAGQGPNGAWVITDLDANILALPEGPPFVLDGAGTGTCLIWWLTFDDLAGAEVGANAGDLTGCFALSNSLTVNRNDDCGGGQEGCTDPNACNYDSDAVVEDNTCEYNDCEGNCGGSAGPGTACGDSGTYNDDCVCIEEPACTVGADCDDGDDSTINDAYNEDCECVGLFIGECMSMGGNLTLVEGGAYGGMNYICAGDCAAVTAGDFLLQDGQGVKIIWHTDGEIVAGSSLPPSNILGSGSFYCNEDGIKQTVYATAFGATKDANDEIDYDDGCLTFSNTIAITFLPPITVSVDVECDDSNGNFTYTFSVDGGLPECAPGESYSVTGDYFNGEIAPGETQSVGPIADGSSYSMTITDPNGCETTYDDDVTCTKLPIVLEIFTGDAINQGNLVKWVTSTEINNDYFSLQASTNGVNFRTIATITGEGNSNTPIAYEHLDRAAAKGTTYYRLIQTDYDGTQSKSHVIDVTRGEASFNITDLYPVPTSDVITLQFVAPEQSTIDIEVFDLIGHTLLEYQRTSNGGISQMDINVEELPAGVYFISIISNDDKVTQKFVIE